MLFIYEKRIKRGHANGCCLQCLMFITTTNYYASEADCCASARSLFPSTHPPPSLSLCASASGREEQRYQLKHICCFSNFTCKYSRNRSTAIVFILCVAYSIFIRRRHDYKSGFFFRLTSWKWVVFQTLFHIHPVVWHRNREICNENSFIENLAALKYSVWHRGKKI